MGLITRGTYNWNIFVSGTDNRGGLYVGGGRLIRGGRGAYTMYVGGGGLCVGRGAMWGKGGL